MIGKQSRGNRYKRNKPIEKLMMLFLIVELQKLGVEESLDGRSLYTCDYQELKWHLALVRAREEI